MARTDFEDFGMKLSARRQDIARDIADILDSVDTAGSFCVGGSLTGKLDRLAVRGFGVLRFPISDVAARRLIKVASRSRFGKGKVNALDTSVRDSWEFGASMWVMDGKGWQRTLSRILDQVAEVLGCPRNRLTISPHKLLVYEPGGKFRPHRDSEKEVGMIGTLTITLPCSGRGGSLVVRHQGMTRKINLETRGESQIAFAAFYADCEHEILELREGYRVCLIYNLIQEKPVFGSRSSGDADHGERVRYLAEALAQWKKGRVGGEKIVQILEHQYSRASLSLDMLKNRDATVASLLQEACQLSDCRVRPAIVTVEQSGEPELAIYDLGIDWGKVRRVNIDKDNSEHVPDEINFLQTDERRMEVQAHPDESFGVLEMIDMKPAIIIPGNVLETLIPDEKSAHGYVVLALKPLRNQFSSTLSAWVLRGIRNIGCQIAALEVDFKLNFGPETGRSGQISRFGDDSTHLAPGACGQS